MTLDEHVRRIIGDLVITIATLSAENDALKAAPSLDTKGTLMAVSKQIHDFSDQFNTATNAIAADLQALRDKVAASAGLSVEDQAVLDASIARLTVLGADPENPIPPVG